MQSLANTLVIDNDVPGAQMVAAILMGRGAQVAVAADSTAGLAILREQPIEVLFVELCLPDSDGIELLRQALRIRPRLAAVALTNQASLGTAIEALRAGACDYVTKPVDRDAVLSAFDRACRSQRLPPGGPAGVSKSRPARWNISPVAVSPAMRELLDHAAEIAVTYVPVLIRGESGVGKQLLAQWIHQRSPCREADFIPINCHAVQNAPPSTQLGWMRLAANDRESSPGEDRWGTVFFEHITALPLWAQRHLLADIEQRELAVDDPAGTGPRVIASTTSDLENAMDEGRFDRGLYHYLSIATLRIPPLRERPQDILPLVAVFHRRFAQRAGLTARRARLPFSDQVNRLLLSYRWPGNVRELKAVLARAVLIPDEKHRDAALMADLQDGVESSPAEAIRVPLSGDYRTIERAVIREVVRRHKGNKAAAARALGIHRRTLYRALERGKSTRPLE